MIDSILRDPTALNSPIVLYNRNTQTHTQASVLILVMNMFPMAGQHILHNKFRYVQRIHRVHSHTHTCTSPRTHTDAVIVYLRARLIIIKFMLHSQPQIKSCPALSLSLSSSSPLFAIPCSLSSLRFVSLAHSLHMCTRVHEYSKVSVVFTCVCVRVRVCALSYF